MGFSKTLYRIIFEIICAWELILSGPNFDFTA